MSELVTAARMRAIEEAAIASGAASGLEMMERAGRGVVEAALALWPELTWEPKRAVVLCGPGNNGGDGFVIARLLHEQGWEARVLSFGGTDRLPPDAAENFRRWKARGRTEPIGSDLGAGLAGADLVVDALFGTGLKRGVDLPLGWIRGPRVVAVDLPTGLCSDSGRVIGAGAVKADLTVTFHRAKPGHYLAEGPRTCGRVVVQDIGLGAEGDIALCRADPARLAKRVEAHKYQHGHALVLCGPAGAGGAARLAARGALRIGAGLVTLACTAEAMAENAARLDAVMLAQVADAAALTGTLGDQRLNALCLGPGLWTGPREVALVEAALASGRPTVLDADALTILAEQPDLMRALHPGCVMTPHWGEFARLFPEIVGRTSGAVAEGPAYSRLDAVRDAAAQVKCTVLLKGADTVIADQTGRRAVNAALYDQAAPWLATAGAGDVLAGFVTGLLARGVEPMSAASMAAWLHAESARRFGPGLIAEDLPEELPKVLRALET